MANDKGCWKSGNLVADKIVYKGKVIKNTAKKDDKKKKENKK